ncbi:hypothetical protein F511_25214 [Dorcoceras hygrometricum]|uniref:Uncharacterized protein n=1 Tax=Dorcoceras hygrometricum TaxID=472368 RepID=A0A2Z7BCZ0_9LAMI|nr:hypothetical protein F511_25214 [Dorcoceras hygrometricum]
MDPEKNRRKFCSFDSWGASAYSHEALSEIYTDAPRSRSINARIPTRRLTFGPIFLRWSTDRGRTSCGESERSFTLIPCSYGFFEYHDVVLYARDDCDLEPPEAAGASACSREVLSEIYTWERPNQRASTPEFQPGDRLPGPSSSGGRKTEAATRAGNRNGVSPSFPFHTDSPSTVTRFYMHGTISTEIRLEGSRTSILPPTILNKLSLISVRELRNQYLCDPQWFRDTASRGLTTFVTPKPHFRTNPSDHGKASATSPHDPIGITDSDCKNQSVMVSVQYGPFNSYIPIESTNIGKSRVVRYLIAMHTSWRSNIDIMCVTTQTHLSKTYLVLWPEICHTIISSDSIGYPRTRPSGESSTTKQRLLHASGPHPTPPSDDPN